MGDNSTIAKKTIYGFDLLKIIMAVLIIAAHTLLFEEYNTLASIRGNVASIAVPTFMAISAYFFFKKIYKVPKEVSTYPILLKTVKRLALLFLCWYILMLPMTYIKFFSVATIKETIFAIFFSCTFNGYWFIKALIINTCIFYLFRKNYSLIVFTIFAWLIYLFFSYNYIFHFIEFPYQPYYSFYYHLAYYSVGVLFAKYGENVLRTYINRGLILVIWLILLALCFFLNCVDPIYRLFSIPLLFIFFYQLDLESKPYYRTMRDMSIILYMVQFVLIWIYNGTCDMWLQSDSRIYEVLQHSISRFVIVTMVSVSIALIILKYEKYPKLLFLHYLH